MKSIKGVRSRAVSEGDIAVERDMVEAEVPDGSVHHAIPGESEHGADDGACKDIPPVVVLVDCESAADEGGAKDGSVRGDKLPHLRVIVRPDLQLRVEVEVEIDEAGESSSGVTRWEGLERVIDLLLVACADIWAVVDLPESIAHLVAIDRYRRLAYVKEVRAETSDEPLEEDLEHSGSLHGVDEPDDCVVHIHERADTDLADEEDHDGDKDTEHSSSPDGDDLIAERERVFWSNDLACNSASAL